jgi:antitoxin ChpS
MAIESGRLMIEPHTRPKYTLEELLAQCDENLELTEEDKEWLNMKPVGAELI